MVSDEVQHEKSEKTLKIGVVWKMATRWQFLYFLSEHIYNVPRKPLKILTWNKLQIEDNMSNYVFKHFEAKILNRRYFFIILYIWPSADGGWRFQQNCRVPSVVTGIFKRMLVNMLLDVWNNLWKFHLIICYTLTLI
jgi:hypothetical protein